MTRPGRYAAPLFAVVTCAAAPFVTTTAAAALGAAGAKAFGMVRTSEDGVAAAGDEGERSLAQVKALTASGRAAESLKTLQEEAEAAHQALAGYRKQVQASATEALQLLVEATRAASATPPDAVRRDVLEQRALLAAHEAAVMAARARAEAERLRAVLAEARAVGAAGGRVEPRAPAVSQTTGPPPEREEGSGREVFVPNLVGARLDGAVRDLEAVGLRLGQTTGPRDGFVVKQVPEAGARVPPRATVSVTLSASAASTTVVQPQ